jgi:hypothetical protein
VREAERGCVGGKLQQQQQQHQQQQQQHGLTTVLGSLIGSSWDLGEQYRSRVEGVVSAGE